MNSMYSLTGVTVVHLDGRTAIGSRLLEQQVIVVTHDLDMLAGFDRVLCLDEGRVLFDGPPHDTVSFYNELLGE